MTPTYDNGVVRLYQGDARDLSGVPDESVHCIVTSPPYWGLRDYGLEPSVWGGDDHEHEWENETVATEIGKGNWAQGVNGRGELQPGGVDAKREPLRSASSRSCCPCGAWRGTLGLEPTIDLYVEHMVEVFRKLWRVLRKDGTCWLNIGDSYASAWSTSRRNIIGNTSPALAERVDRLSGCLKDKDLCMMPARVALALQADGWWVRSDVVWSKPNPMPESVTDRCTKAHEYIFLLSKSPRYYYDADAIKEDLVYPNETRRPLGSKGAWQMDGRGQRDNGGGAEYEGYPDKRNKRSVWTVTTKPFKGAHFATFPPDLIEPCVLAGCPEGGIVLDPFGGAGTAGMVADRLGRNAVLIELNAEYAEMAHARLYDDSPLFAQFTQEETV